MILVCYVTLNTELLVSTTVAPETLSSLLHVLKIDEPDICIQTYSFSYYYR